MVPASAPGRRRHPSPPPFQDDDDDYDNDLGFGSSAGGEAFTGVEGQTNPEAPKGVDLEAVLDPVSVPLASAAFVEEDDKDDDDALYRSKAQSPPPVVRSVHGSLASISTPGPATPLGPVPVVAPPQSVHSSYYNKLLRTTLATHKPSLVVRLRLPKPTPGSPQKPVDAPVASVAPSSPLSPPPSSSLSSPPPSLPRPRRSSISGFVEEEKPAKRARTESTVDHVWERYKSEAVKGHSLRNRGRFMKK